MPKLPPTHRPKGYKGRQQSNKDYDASRTGTPERLLYAKRRWRDKVRPVILARDPLCVRCLAEGRSTPSDTVNHIIPHKGNPELFWDMDNLEGVCASHHSRDIQREEQSLTSSKVNKT